jgi:hypothetical protein
MAGVKVGGERVPQVTDGALDEEGIADSATFGHPRHDTRAGLTEVVPLEVTE